jgi:hypothetical protein
MSILLYCYDDGDYSYAINQLIDRFPSEKIHLNGVNFGFEFDSNKISFSKDRRELINRSVDAEKIIILSQDKPCLNDDFLASSFSCFFKTICWMNMSGEVLDMKREGDSNILFVFPGPILPLSLGSHQRAFMLSNLKSLGYNVDVLIPKVDKNQETKLINSLEVVCQNVFFYKNKKRKFKKVDLLKRGIEKRIRRFLGKDEILQDKFSERLYSKPTESSKRVLNSLYHAKKYPVVIVSYAWMMGIFDIVRPFLDGSTKIICDSHDVQFERSKGYLNRKERLFFSYKKERDLEIACLNSADIVLAISNSDKKILEKEGIKARVINSSAGFDYQLRQIRARPIDRPINFGFIGGGMDANVRSLEFILKSWWPVIKKYSPESCFYIAGSVANNKRIKQLIFLDQKVQNLGFVKNLDDFYKVIDVSLNPVLVQGGLNFKSVEAVFSGKHLITNSLGKECLGEDFECFVADQPVDIVNYLKSFEFDSAYDKEIRKRAQDKAKNLFGNKNVVIDLKNYLSTIIV